MDFKETLQNHFPLQAEKIHYLSPFDTRLQLGKSQQRHESKIFYQIDLSELLNDYAIFKVLFYVAQHPDTELVIGVYNAWQEGIKQVENKVEELISDYLDLKDFIKKSFKNNQAENPLPENQELEYRFRIRNITDELSLIQELDDTRLIIDLSQQPNLYTQIAGISAGIPQINLVASDYVTHLQNGYILDSISQLAVATDYYLQGLKNWNQALIYSIEKIKLNTGHQVIKRWEKWLKEAIDEK